MEIWVMSATPSVRRRVEPVSFADQPLEHMSPALPIVRPTRRTQAETQVFDHSDLHRTYAPRVHQRGDTAHLPALDSPVTDLSQISESLDGLAGILVTETDDNTTAWQDRLAREGRQLPAQPRRAARDVGEGRRRRDDPRTMPDRHTCQLCQLPAQPRRAARDVGEGRRRHDDRRAMPDRHDPGQANTRGKSDDGQD